MFRDDDEDRTGECLYPSDFADFKPRADVLLRGTCYTPGRKRMTEYPVKFGVGAWSKILRVTGDRVWLDGVAGPTMSDPVPFDRMPLDDRHSFGGPGYARNPVGKGYNTRELPNVEDVKDLVLSRSDRPAPAGFGPISPSRPERMEKMGKKYGQSYREKQAPYYAEDFDWSYFNAAPPDQQLPYLRGDEELLFQNLHPDVEILRSRLPGLRIRAFVNDPEGRFREVPMHLDTLFVDLDKEALFLTWRGLDEVKDDDISRYNTLVASEPLGEPPLPEAHYREILRKFEADPVEIEEHLPEELKGEWRALQALREQRAKGAPPPEPSGLEPLSALLKERLGDLAKPQQEKIREAMARLSDVPLEGGRTLGSALAEALRQPPKAAQGGLGGLSLESLPPVTSPEIRRSFRALARAVQEARAAATARGMAPSGMEAWDQLLSDPRIAAMGLSPAAPSGAEEPGPGSDLSGQDLSDRDLSGRDLTGADLTSAILSGADLRGTKLARAKLKQAVLFEADLTGADLTGADLTLATLQSARAEGAVFRDATIALASFESARLAGADLSGTHGQQMVFSRADMTRASARRAQWHMAFLEGTTLDGADLSEATLPRCLVAKGSGVGATFAGATVTDSSFSGSDLRQARFTGARGDGSVWLGAILAGADFSLATLVRSHFSEADATRATFFGANLRGARFYRATLERADFTRANLFDADLHKALVPEAKFVGASLYDAKFYQAAGSGCDFSGANLKRSTLERDR